MSSPARGFASLVLLLALIGLAVIGGGAYLTLNHESSLTSTTGSVSTSTTQQASMSPLLASSSPWQPITIQDYSQKDGYPAYMGADPTTFEMSAVYNFYSRDRNNVYWEDQIVPGADKETFVVLGGSGNDNNTCDFAKDKNHLYYEGQIVPTQANLASLKLILDARGFFTGYAVDDAHVYCNNCDDSDKALTPIPGADPRTFTALVGFDGRVTAPLPANTTPVGPYTPMGMDASHVYVESVAQSGMDAHSFATLYVASDYSYFKDSHAIYLYYYIGGKPVVLPDADQTTFNPHPKSFYAQIKSQESADTFSADSQHVYVNGKLVPGADPQTFEVLATAGGYDTQYEKDKSSIYFLDKPVTGADYGTFTVDTFQNSTSTPYYDAQDKNSHYLNGQVVPSTFFRRP